MTAPMPIKLPKTFTRRKSSGNILDEVESHPQSSFKVYERPGQRRSMTDGAPLTKRMSEGNAVPSMLSTEDSDNIFAGAEQPPGKHRATYESSTSTRLSSSSTLPSSTEIPPPNDPASPHSRIYDIPAPPALAGALRAAGRTFSFGRFSKTSTTPAPPRHATPDMSARRRGQTGSTDTTPTPSRLPDAQFTLGADLGAGSDDFGQMFDHIGKRNSAVLRDPPPQRANQYSSSPPTQALPEFQTEGRAARPAPINVDRSVAVEPSPYSWDRDSRHSEENLLNDPEVARMGDLVIDKHSPGQSTPEMVTGFRRPSPSPSQMLGATTSHRALERPRRQSDFGLRRSGAYSGGRDSNPVDDEDAKLVRQSLLWSNENSPTFNETPLLDKGKAASPSEHLSPDRDSMFADRHSPRPGDSMDPSIADHARLAVQFAESLPKSTSPGNKVMTPSQFEHYRQQQELRRSNSNATQSDDESANEEFDEEDEVEKQREAERQRRKQEAHLSVYRQQMMKVTGQQASTPSLRPVAGTASSSTPTLNRLSNPGDKSSSGKSSEDDDEEVPLGILAAHGFPSRNRPPTRLANTGSNPNLRASMHAHPYASSASSVTGVEHGNRNSLPVFARHLPRDPYFGASLVNPANRESLALGGGSGSVYGGNSSQVPPGGLVGVIANEERARAMRRGSPNTQAMYDTMGVPRPYSMMGAHQHQVSASEQAQVQLSQQMADMMQLQMQWMQQMMQMQGMQGPPPPMMGGMPMPGAPTGTPSVAGPIMADPPSIAGGNPNMRPVSMLGAVPGAAPNSHQRTLSVLDPNIATRRPGSAMPHLSGPPFQSNTPGYAPSITPSERSNAGLASRYRPVSVMPGEPGHHASSSLYMGWNDENQHPSLAVAQSHPHLPKSSSLATVTVRPIPRTTPSAGRKPPNASDDDDDDEAWAEMMKKRDKKKSNWKLKRGTSSFGDLLSAVH